LRRGDGPAREAPRLLIARAIATAGAPPTWRILTLRILHVYKDYSPVVGGIENHIRVLAEAQAAAGHEVAVLVCDPGGLAGIERRAGVDVIRARRLATALSMPLSLHQPWLTARHRADIVHVHSPFPLGEITALAVRRRTRFVITYHSDVLRQRTALRLYAPLLRQVLRSADRIVATSPRYVESSPWLRPLADRCCVIPLGVDPDRFTPGPGVGRAELLFVGRLRHYKGLDVLLRTLAGLPDVRLRVVGEGPMGTAWRSLAHELGVARRVQFEGEVADPDLPGVYRDAGILVLPSTSRAEAFGTVLLEAMASGLPCIATEVGTGTSWVVQHGVTGRIVPAGDVDALRGTVAELVADPGARAAMGAAGRRRVEQHFTEAAMNERILDLYGELLRVRPGPGGPTEAAP
jgi:glycosyltransferase involved in cell wall biosynthesis